MSETRPDLWPDDIDVTSIVPPLVILREQAALLGERTKGLVRGEVESTEEPKEGFEEYLEDALPPKSRVVHVHTLYLVAPALDNYKYSLLSVRHDFQPYPCEALFLPAPEGTVLDRFGNPNRIEGRDVFVHWLGLALSHNRTTRLIHALISRTQELGAT